jgi:hypothetical protein
MCQVLISTAAKRLVLAPRNEKEHGKQTTKSTAPLRAELDREAVGIRNTLERVQEGKMTGNRMS